MNAVVIAVICVPALTALNVVVQTTRPGKKLMALAATLLDPTDPEGL